MHVKIYICTNFHAYNINFIILSQDTVYRKPPPAKNRVVYFNPAKLLSQQYLRLPTVFYVGRGSTKEF